jgi:hypothetical protein
VAIPESRTYGNPPWVQPTNRMLDIDDERPESLRLRDPGWLSLGNRGQHPLEQAQHLDILNPARHLPEQQIVRHAIEVGSDQFVPQLQQKRLDPGRLDRLERDPITPGAPLLRLAGRTQRAASPAWARGRTDPEPPVLVSLRLDAEPPPQVLQTNGRHCQDAALPSVLPEACRTQGLFTPRALPRLVARTGPSATPSSSAGPGGTTMTHRLGRADQRAQAPPRPRLLCLPWLIHAHSAPRSKTSYFQTIKKMAYGSRDRDHFKRPSASTVGGSICTGYPRDSRMNRTFEATLAFTHVRPRPLAPIRPMAG